MLHERRRKLGLPLRLPLVLELSPRCRAEFHGQEE